MPVRVYGIWSYRRETQKARTSALPVTRLNSCVDVWRSQKPQRNAESAYLCATGFPGVRPGGVQRGVAQTCLSRSAAFRRITVELASWPEAECGHRVTTVCAEGSDPRVPEAQRAKRPHFPSNHRQGGRNRSVAGNMVHVCLAEGGLSIISCCRCTQEKGNRRAQIDSSEAPETAAPNTSEWVIAQENGANCELGTKHDA